MVAALSAFIATLDASIVNVSLPTLSRTFSAPIDLVAWVVLAYSLTITSILLLVGRIAVRKGYRFTYLTGFSLFTLGSLFCSLSNSIWPLIASRVLQGIGSAFLMASGPALITRAFPVRERGRGMGIIGTAVGVGLMSGPPLGGYLVTAVGWQSVFLINIPIGIFGFIYAGRLLRLLKPDHPESRIDLVGAIFQIIGIVCLLLFFNRLYHPDWTPEMLTLLIGLAVAGMAGFFWRETHTENPLLGLSIFSHRQFSIAIATSLIAFTCISAGLVLIPFYLEELLHLLPRQVGLVLVSIPICTLIVAPIAGRVSDAIGYRFLTTAGLIIFIFGVFWTATLDADSSRFDVVQRLIMIGVGLGIFQTPNSSAMMSSVPKQNVGIASGLLAVARNLGLATGVAVSTAMFTSRRSFYGEVMSSAESFESAFQWVVAAVGCLAIVAVIISILRQNRPEKFV